MEFPDGADWALDFVQRVRDTGRQPEEVVLDDDWQWYAIACAIVADIERVRAFNRQKRRRG